MEEWMPLQDYPGYSVSNLGQVRNDKRSSLLSVTHNQSGVSIVGLMHNGIQVKRSLAKLICEAFVPNPQQQVPFTTPIHLNGDPINCQADNLLWRPRWFALKHSRQFKLHLPERPPVRVIQTGEMFEGVWPFVLSYGLLYMDVILSILNFTYVFPVMYNVEWAIKK